MKLKNQIEQHAFWKGHIEGWKESGLSQARYCETQGIKLTTFSYYRHVFLNSTSSAIKSDFSMKFLSVPAKETNFSQPSAAPLQLLLPNGIRIGISLDVPEPFLKMVLNVAGQVSC